MAANTRSRDRNDGLYKFWRENYVRMDSCCLPEINKKNKVVHLKQRIKLHIGKCSEDTSKSEERSTCQNVGGKYTKFTDKFTDKKMPQMRTYTWLCKMLQRQDAEM